MNFKIEIAGDQSVLVIFGNTINKETNQSVHFLAESIELANIDGIEETILGYTNLLIQYNPFYLSFDELQEKLIFLINKTDKLEFKERNIVEIPVLYGSVWGPDLEDVANFNQLTEDEVIEIHTAPSYTVYFLGFTPGFPFLGGISERIATPRLPNPRVRIDAGSVGIANNQTGIYPVSSPGGWRLIGHTPLPLYDTDREWPFLLDPGDQLIFKSINKEEYGYIINETEKGTYNYMNHVTKLADYKRG